MSLESSIQKIFRKPLKFRKKKRPKCDLAPNFWLKMALLYIKEKEVR
jgi:hypothetical protein